MIYAVFAFSTIIILFAMYKTGHFFKSLLLSAFQGISALFAVNLIGNFIGIHLSLNIFSISASSLFGMSGVIYLLVCNIADKI